MSYTLLQLDDLDRIQTGGAGWWRPIRRALGVTSVGVNAYTADEEGAELIERHDENSPGAGQATRSSTSSSAAAPRSSSPARRSTPPPARCC